MLSNQEHEALKQRFVEKGTDPNAAAAFIFLSDVSYYSDVHTNIRGIGQPKLSLRFERNGVTPFSAILNQNSVLWYFRRPAFEIEKVSKSDLFAAFSSATENPSGEVTIKLFKVVDAKNLVEWVFKK